jgi:hypothetical protein
VFNNQDVSHIDLFLQAVVQDSGGSLGDGDSEQIAANCVLLQDSEQQEK